MSHTIRADERDLLDVLKKLRNYILKQKIRNISKDAVDKCFDRIKEYSVFAEKYLELFADVMREDKNRFAIGAHPFFKAQLDEELVKKIKIHSDMILKERLAATSEIVKGTDAGSSLRTVQALDALIKELKKFDNEMKVFVRMLDIKAKGFKKIRETVSRKSFWRRAA